MITTEITKDGPTWKAVISNGSKYGLKVHIEGMETKAIAKQQAKNRIKEMKKAGLI
jgi:hypothetical protein